MEPSVHCSSCTRAWMSGVHQAAARREIVCHGMECLQTHCVATGYGSGLLLERNTCCLGPTSSTIASSAARAETRAASSEVPLVWKTTLGPAWYVYVGVSAAVFGVLTLFACSQYCYRSHELFREARRRSGAHAGKSAWRSVEYRRLMIAISVAIVFMRFVWHLDPASFEGLMPPAVTFMLLRLPQCLLFVQALFIVAFA